MDEQKKKWSPGTIVGVVIAGILGLLFLFGIFGGILVLVLQNLGLMKMTGKSQGFPDLKVVHIGPHMTP